MGVAGSDTTGALVKVYDENTEDNKDDMYIGARAVSNGRYMIGGTVSPTDDDYSYFGFNTLHRLSANFYCPTNVNATRTLRSFSINYLNNRNMCHDDTSAFNIAQTLVQTTPDLYAFAENNMGTDRYHSWSWLYYIVITSNTDITNVFVPCYRNSDNVIGMYDIVNGIFKTNQGSGTFVYES